MRNGKKEWHVLEINQMKFKKKIVNQQICDACAIHMRKAKMPIQKSNGNRNKFDSEWNTMKSRKSTRNRNEKECDRVASFQCCLRN